MAGAGVSYVTGREANSLFNETYDGWQLRDKHQFPDGIDPYRKPGDPSSGLLWGISGDTPDSTGAGDWRIQAYNFRICLTNDPANRMPISQPANYNPDHYALLLRLIAARPEAGLSAYLNINDMPNHKTDINNNGAFSTDMIGMNRKQLSQCPLYAGESASEFGRRTPGIQKGCCIFLAMIRGSRRPCGPKCCDGVIQRMNSYPPAIGRHNSISGRRGGCAGEYIMTEANCVGLRQPSWMGLEWRPIPWIRTIAGGWSFMGW